MMPDDKSLELPLEARLIRPTTSSLLMVVCHCFTCGPGGKEITKGEKRNHQRNDLADGNRTGVRNFTSQPTISFK